MSIFGVKIAIAYVLIGLVIAVVGGTLIEKMHMEKYVEDFVYHASNVDISSPALTKKERVQYAKEQVAETFKKVFPYILVGVGIGAIIHNWIPESWIETVLGSNNPLGVVLAALVGIDVCRYFRYDTSGRGIACQRRAVRYNFGIYDGGNNIKPAINNYAQESRKA